jgi:hypothetical protein
MDEKGLRLFIRNRLKNGRLPYDGASNVSGGPASGEVCVACETVVADEQLVMEGLIKNGDGTKPIQFHVVCFGLWNDERRRPRETVK